MFPLLETKRLKLREITTKDVSSIFECFSNEQLTRYYGQDPFENIEQAKKLANMLITEACERTKQLYPDFSVPDKIASLFTGMVKKV